MLASAAIATAEKPAKGGAYTAESKNGLFPSGSASINVFVSWLHLGSDSSFAQIRSLFKGMNSSKRNCNKKI